MANILICTWQKIKRPCIYPHGFCLCERQMHDFFNFEDIFELKSNIKFYSFWHYFTVARFLKLIVFRDAKTLMRICIDGVDDDEVF